MRRPGVRSPSAPPKKSARQSRANPKPASQRAFFMSTYLAASNQNRFRHPVCSHVLTGTCHACCCKNTAKGQASIPQDIYAAMHVSAGDLIAWELGADGTATVRRCNHSIAIICVRSKIPFASVRVRPTRKPIVDFERFTVVRVPFSFTDKATRKNRPTLVVSDAAPFNCEMVLPRLVRERPTWARRPNPSGLLSRGRRRPTACSAVSPQRPYSSHPITSADPALMVGGVRRFTH